MGWRRDVLWPRPLLQDQRARRAHRRLDRALDLAQQRPGLPPKEVRIGATAFGVPPIEKMVQAARLAWAVRGLPTVSIELSEGAGGRAIAASMLAFCGGHGDKDLRARSAYLVPADGQPYVGRKHHSRRNAVNRSRAAGVRVESISTDRLLAEAPLQGMGICPAAHECDGRTVVALDRSGDLLAITHLHVDGSVAELRQAVHLADNPLTDLVRYAVWAEVVSQLAAAKVRLLLVLANYLDFPAGRRRYQHLLGCRPVNLRVRLTTDREQLGMVAKDGSPQDR